MSFRHSVVLTFLEDGMTACFISNRIGGRLYILPLAANHSSSCFLSKDREITVTTADSSLARAGCFSSESSFSQLQLLKKNQYIYLRNTPEL